MNPIRPILREATWHQSMFYIYRIDLENWQRLIDEQQARIKGLEAQLVARRLCERPLHE